MKGAATHSARLRSLGTILQAHKQPPFRLRQISERIYRGFVPRYSEMPNLPKELRDDIAGKLTDNVLSIKEAERSLSSQATKLLFSLHDNQKIESVYMKFEKGNTSLCISSQVGCAMACSFCSTGAVGFKRNMTPDEITDQVLYFLQQKVPVDSISFMGMGEPLINPNVYHAIDMLTSPDLFGISPRRISVSTVGIIPGIVRMTKEYPYVNLAYSLHTPFPEERAKIIPSTQQYPVEDTLKALDEHIMATKRRVFLSYLILDGVNDSQNHVQALADLILRRPHTHRNLYHVNLLRFNPALDLPFSRASEERFKRFMDQLVEKNISASTRQSFGLDIDAACGQLYAQYDKKQPKKRPVSASTPV